MLIPKKNIIIPITKNVHWKSWDDKGFCSGVGERGNIGDMVGGKLGGSVGIGVLDGVLGIEIGEGVGVGEGFGDRGGVGLVKREKENWFEVSVRNWFLNGL